MMFLTTPAGANKVNVIKGAEKGRVIFISLNINFSSYHPLIRRTRFMKLAAEVLSDSLRHCAIVYSPQVDSSKLEKQHFAPFPRHTKPEMAIIPCLLNCSDKANGEGGGSSFEFQRRGEIKKEKSG